MGKNEEEVAHGKEGGERRSVEGEEVAHRKEEEEVAHRKEAEEEGAMERGCAQPKRGGGSAQARRRM